MPDLLLELRSEEIPARMQIKGKELLCEAVESRLKGRGLDWKTSETFVTPRRLALIIRGLPDEIPKSREERRGPRVGAPDKAVAGFLRSTGVTYEMLDERGEGADRVYFAVWDKPAQPLHEVLAEILPEAIQAVRWPKSMRWGRGNFRWIRPLRSILCIFGNNTKNRVVELDIEGIPCGRVTRGHPYMVPAEFIVESVGDYERSLDEAKVILRAEDRREMIIRQCENIAGRTGLEPVYASELLDEIVGLVEWPKIYIGQIDNAFLDLPNDLLHVSMRKHQKFISIWNEKSKRIEKFAAVADIQAADGGKQIEAGYERVLRARLTDAKFFWENDKRTGIEAMSRGLSGMAFHSALGDMDMRTERISKLAKEIAKCIGESEEDMFCAGKISKVDLCSETVREFPELQGIAGGLLAEEAGKNEKICGAVKGQYYPYGSDGPTTPGPATLVFADRADMLWGFFAAGERPTGSGDPYALRRAALAILRTLIAKKIYFSLDKLISLAENQYENMPLSLPKKMSSSARENVTKAVVKFMLERLRVYMSEGGYFKWVINKLGDLRICVDKRKEEPGILEYISGELKLLCEDVRGGKTDTLKWVIDDLQRLHTYIDKCEGRTEDFKWISYEFEQLRGRVHRCKGEGGPKMGYGPDAVIAAERRGVEDDPYWFVRMVFHLDQLFRPAFRKPEMDNFLAAYRRVTNILEAEGNVKIGKPDPELCCELEKLPGPLEQRHLAKTLNSVRSEIGAKKLTYNPPSTLEALVKLRQPIHDFFDKVHVNHPDSDQRSNHLRLLTQVRDVMEWVANFGAIQD